MKNQRALTLIEIVVVLAIIGILGAMLAVAVLQRIEDARISRASEDVKVISTALNDLMKDTGQYPGDLLFGRSFLVGPGNLASGADWAASASDARLLSNHLFINDPDETGVPNEPADYRSSGKFRWRGIYVEGLKEDPWGNAYEVNASTLTGGDTSPTWAISAGPDETFQTATTDTVIAGDDIGIRIK